MGPYWFMPWESVSIAGGAGLHSAVLRDTHPFEYLVTLQERYASSDVNVSITITSFRPIDSVEYALGERAGLA